MSITRKIRAAAVAVGVAVAIPATAASAFTVSQSPVVGQFPGQPITITVDFDESANCTLDVTANEVVDVMIQDTASVDVPAARVEDVNYDEANGRLVFTVNIPAGTTVFGPWQFFVVRDGGTTFSSVIPEATIAGGRACPTEGNSAMGNFDVLDPAANAPLMPTEMVVGAGLAAVAAGGWMVLRHRRQAAVTTLA